MRNFNLKNISNDKENGERETRNTCLQFIHYDYLTRRRMREGNSRYSYVIMQFLCYSLHIINI